MELKENKKIHQGRNIYYGRMWKNVSQEGLALSLNMNQNDISRLEKKEKVEPKLLQQIAEILSIPYEFFTEFQIEDAIATYINNVSTEANNDSAQNIGSVATQQFDVINNPVADIHTAYDKMINYLKGENLELKHEIKQLKTQLGKI